MTAQALARCAVAATDALEAAGACLDWWITDMTPEPLRVQGFKYRVAAGLGASDAARRELQLPRVAARRPGGGGDAHGAVPRGGGFRARRARGRHLRLITGSSPAASAASMLVERAR